MLRLSGDEVGNWETSEAAASELLVGSAVSESRVAAGEVGGGGRWEEWSGFGVFEGRPNGLCC